MALTLADVIPIHKTDEKNIMKNYCPVSLSSAAQSNQTESVIQCNVFNHLQKRKYTIPKPQKKADILKTNTKFNLSVQVP